ncbi:MAG: bis(5'-nucleosyl)-tetraphosphatase (symmetrical) YqeK [Clostridia bacterium]|nr:bis(5'-nucleosyl)-tetraphosphatase (symmetrical) YqeK [Clostridia bacterium]
MHIGILGGMMDPVHIGHMNAARAALRAGMDTVLIAPCQSPAHRAAPAATAEDRVAMCRLATAEEKQIEVSTVDLREGPCYTADTIRILQAQYPAADLWWIIGADKLSTLPRWRDKEYLFTHCGFLVCPRTFSDTSVKVPGARIRVLDAEAMTASSGQVVAALHAYDDAADLLPHDVSRYIALHGLYQPDYMPDLIRFKLSESRIRHTLGVRETAVELADRFGARMQAAAVAAILHDIAKALPLSEMQDVAKRWDLALPEDILESGDLLHGPAGAAIAGHELGIRDPEILSAIACHTVGKPGMSKLEKILFIADAIEPNRRPYPGLEDLRRLVQTDLDAAVLASMRRTREYVLSKGGSFCTITEAAMRELAAQKEENA